jgi:hypothetical protein
MIGNRPSEVAFLVSAIFLFPILLIALLRPVHAARLMGVSSTEAYGIALIKRSMRWFSLMGMGICAVVIYQEVLNLIGGF